MVLIFKGDRILELLPHQPLKRLDELLEDAKALAVEFWINIFEFYQIDDAQFHNVHVLLLVGDEVSQDTDQVLADLAISLF